MALDAPGRWHHISVWRLAEGGEDEPTAVPAAVPTRGGGSRSFHCATCQAPGQELGRQGCR